MAPSSCSSEDFSFPALTSHDSHHSGLDSPPLWKLSPARTPQNQDEDDEHEDRFARKPSKKDQRKSFSYVEMRNCWNLDREEKMDMLWEDLNEELTRSSSLKIESDVVTRSNNNNNDEKTRSLSEDTAVNLGCGIGRSLKVSKPEKKKPNMLVFMKVLKKLLLLRNSSHRSPVKTHPR